MNSFSYCPYQYFKNVDPSILRGLHNNPDATLSSPAVGLSENNEWGTIAGIVHGAEDI